MTWKALRPSYPCLRSGTPRCTALRREARSALARAEWLARESKWQDCVDVLARVRMPATSAPDLAFRLLHCEAWARMYLGELDAADALCERARALAEGEFFDDSDRAEALFRLGACRLKASRIGNAVSLFTEALRADAGRRPAPRPGPGARVRMARALLRDAARLGRGADGRGAGARARGVAERRAGCRRSRRCSARSIAERRGKVRLALFYADERAPPRRRVRRPADGGAPPEQPRRAELPARRCRAGRRVHQAGVRAVPRDRQ